MTYLRALGQAFMALLAFGCVGLLAILIAGCRVIGTGAP